MEHNNDKRTPLESAELFGDQPSLQPAKATATTRGNKRSEIDPKCVQCHNVRGIQCWVVFSVADWNSCWHRGPRRRPFTTQMAIMEITRQLLAPHHPLWTNEGTLQYLRSI